MLKHFIIKNFIFRLTHKSFLILIYMKNNFLKNIDHNKINVPGKPKHFPHSNREWLNSIYTYNKNNLLNTPHNDNILNVLLNMYFHLRLKKGNIFKSKRMRDLIKRSTTKQIILSKAEVKQTSDKAIVTIYTYNRESVFFKKKLFYLKNRLYALSNYGNSITISLKKKIIKKYNKLYRKKLFKVKRKLASRYNVNFKKYSNLLLKSLLAKQKTLKVIYLYRFLKWSLSMLNINVFFFKNKKVHVIYNNNIHTLLIQNSIVITKGNKYTYLYMDDKKVACINASTYFKQLNFNGNLSLIKLRTINNILITYFNAAVKDNSNIILTNLLSYYKLKYNVRYTKRFFRKQKLAFRRLKKLYENRRKYDLLIPRLKVLINYIYKKKTELNIVNLKYLHLNSHMLSEAIAIKLRKKTSRLLRVLRKAMKIVKVPKNLFFKGEANLLHRLKHLNISDLSNKAIKNGYNISDTIQSILSQMFFKKKYNMLSYKDNSLVNNILNTIKYKWVTGARVEAKGRLTRRFTASRAVFKFKKKGSLKNLEHMYKPEYTNTTASIVNLRNQVKPNIQYTLATSKRRIGTYGIKGWISSM